MCVCVADVEPFHDTYTMEINGDAKFDGSYRTGFDVSIDSGGTRT